MIRIKIQRKKRNLYSSLMVLASTKNMRRLVRSSTTSDSSKMVKNTGLALNLTRATAFTSKGTGILAREKDLVCNSKKEFTTRMASGRQTKSKVSLLRDLIFLVYTSAS